MSPRKIIGIIKNFPNFIADMRALNSQARRSRFKFPITNIKYYPLDRKRQSGTASGHYFHQDLHVAQRIFAQNPARHVDIGSRVDGFVAHVAAFREIEVFDIRPLDSSSTNIVFRQADLMNIGSEMENYCDSLSCLHALEHFGLGRYGDCIDFEGHLTGLRSITRVLKDCGTLYLSCPIGKEQRIEFNAHRVFSIAHIIQITQPDFILKHFYYVDDNGDFHSDIALDDARMLNSFECVYGCGIFEFEKRPVAAYSSDAT